MNNTFAKVVRTALVMVYLVVIAGALVRMTGSGMGCPDWPKCFGYYIPPTDEKALLWEPNKTFEKGQVIIYEEKLLVANGDFTTGDALNIDNWDPYTKHDYATFNVYHTWTEYLNRLCGALAGIACFVMAIWSFFVKNNPNKKWIITLSWLVVFMMAFQAWLGATVVYSVLNPIRITLHMVVALIIIAVIINILNMVVRKSVFHRKDNLFNGLLVVSLIMSLIQIILGTQVRQFVDHKVKELGYDQMSLILVNPDVNFFIHRTFSIAVVALVIYMVMRNNKLQLGYKKMNWVLLMIIFEIITGMIMYYLDFPFGMQTAHLVIASVLFGIQYFMILEAKNAKYA